MLLKLEDYERIYKVINSVIKNEGSDPLKCCILFSAYGAYILSHYYNIDAQPKAGLAAYHVGGDNVVLLFGEKQGEYYTGKGNAFHCWVEAEGWVIDFMTPAFVEIKNQPVLIPAYMFQKPISTMRNSLLQVKKVGDFFLESTPESTAKHMRILTEESIYSKLAEICIQWFTVPPREIQSIFSNVGDKGIQNRINLTGHKIVGAW